MSDLIEKIRAAIDEDERAIDAYDAHRSGKSPCVNYEGQDPAHYDEWDSCSTHVATSNACRYGDMDFGRRQVAAHRKILDMLKIETHGDLSVEIPGETLCDDWCVRSVGEYLLTTLAEAYGIEP